MRLVKSIEDFPIEVSPIHVAVGMFDGVHLGHQTVIASAQKAAELDTPSAHSAVLTFDPHPSRFFNSEKPIPQAMNLEIKSAFLERLGIDFLIAQPFDKQLATLEAEAFVRKLKKCIPTLKSIHVGENFRFGRQRKGDPILMEKVAAEIGVKVTAISSVEYDSERISSTRIRRLIMDGHFEKAVALMGHGYAFMGTVKTGRGIGRQIGYPTLNVHIKGDIPPPFGVYAVRFNSTSLQSSEPLNGIANFGIRPTFDVGEDPILEIHSFEELPPIDINRVSVVLEKFIRTEKTFNGVEELKSQIRKDVKIAKAYFLNSESELS